MARFHRILHELKSPAQRLFAKNLAVLAAGELLSRALTAAAFIHLGRVLSPSIYGAVELTLAVIMLLTLVVDQGFATVGAREVARKPDEAETLVRRILSLQIVLALAASGSLLIAVIAFSIEQPLALLLAGYAATLLIYPFIIGWVFQGRDQMLWVTLPLTLRQAVFAAIVLLTTRGQDDVAILPIAEMAAMLSAAAVSLIVFRRSGARTTLGFREGLDWQLFRETLPIGCSQMIWAVRMFLPTIVVAALVAPASVGLYGAAHRVVMTLQAFLTVYFKNLLPSMSRVAAASVTRLRTMLWQSTSLLLALVVSFAAVVTLWAGFVLGLLYGATYVQQESIAVLALLIWLIPIWALRRHGHYALITMGRQREELACSVAGVICLLLLLIPLTYSRGIVGASFAMVVSELVGTGLTWWRVLVNLRDPLWANRHLQRRDRLSP